jgi:DNA-binding winged helix-turn-helix (wHTH) protein/Tol biopolymer transport system component
VNTPVRQPVYSFDGFRLDAHRRVLYGADGLPIPLTPRLVDLLLYLVERPGRLLPKEELLNAIWPRTIVEEHNLNKAISELRRVLGEKRGEHRFIVTKPGSGYRFVADVSSADSSLERGVGAETVSGGTSQQAARTAPANPLPATTRPRPPRGLRLAAAIGGTAVLALAIGVAMWEPPGPRSGAELRVIPLSFEREGGEIPHVVGSTVWKPDSRAIAYAQRSREAQTPPQPYVLYLDGSAPQRLTQRFARGLPKQWIPTGHIVLNTSNGPYATSESAGLWIVPGVGGEPEPLFTPPPGTSNTLSITADGSTVAALRRDEQSTWGIWTGPIASGALERYEPAPFAAMRFINTPALSFSPNGRRLLLLWNTGSQGEEAWLLPYPADANDPPRRVLTSLPNGSGTPMFSWLPDNRHIVLSAAEPGNPWRLYLADLESGNFEPLFDATSTAQQLGPVVSPDGMRVAFTEDASHLDVVTLNVRTAAVARLIATHWNEEMPAWSADRERLVYVTDRNGEREIRLRDSAGDRALVTQGNFPPGTTTFLMGPALSPDGTRVIYARIERDTRGITRTRLWMSSVDGGEPMLLRDVPEEHHVGSWSPDAAWYVYLDAKADGTHVLKKVRTSGTSEPEILAMTGGHPSNAAPIWSPDGRWILFDDDGLNLIAADGSETRDLKVGNALCAFAHEPEQLHCIDNVSSGDRTLVSRSFGGTTRVVGSLGTPDNWPVASGGPALRMTLTADGEHLTYSAGTPRVRLLLLEGLQHVPRP